MLAKRYNVSYEEIRRFNQMGPEAVLKVGFTLDIPFPGEVAGDTHTVKPGDSVARIADFYGVAQNDLRAANGFKKGDGVRVGQQIKIPHVLRGGVTKGHVIRVGDTLASIAKKHDVPVNTLARANKLDKGDTLELGRTLVIPDDESDVQATYRPKKINTLVKTGRKVTGGVKHTVQPGQSLWVIARAYNTTGDRIAAANGFEKGDGVNAGQEILIPGARNVVPVRVRGFTTQPIHFVSVWNDKRVNLKLLNNQGRIIQRNRKILSNVTGARKGGRSKLLHPRLIHMLERVAERYPGRIIEVVSGYRPRKKGQRVSKHNLGRAVDFRVQGVDRKELFEFVKSLPKVGAGYYPNSVFVHMDVRDKSTFWVDYSGVGEPAQYSREGLDPEAAADAE
jgi:LysM repeat protein